MLQNLDVNITLFSPLLLINKVQRIFYLIKLISIERNFVRVSLNTSPTMSKCCRQRILYRWDVNVGTRHTNSDRSPFIFELKFDINIKVKARHFRQMKWTNKMALCSTKECVNVKLICIYFCYLFNTRKVRAGPQAPRWL